MAAERRRNRGNSKSTHRHFCQINLSWSSSKASSEAIGALSKLSAPVCSSGTLLARLLPIEIRKNCWCCCCWRMCSCKMCVWSGEGHIQYSTAPIDSTALGTQWKDAMERTLYFGTAVRLSGINLLHSLLVDKSMPEVKQMLKIKVCFEHCLEKTEEAYLGETKLAVQSDLWFERQTG